MDVEPYDPARDLAAAQLIWEECRWVEDDDDKAALVHFLEDTSAWVARLDGQAECLVTTTPGTMRHQQTDLALSVVSSVTTSLVGRKQHLAGGVLAHAVRTAAAEGAVVSALGMFEQGFYDRAGFGTGSYENRLTFDPASLSADLPYRRPVRLTIDDVEEVHACMATRMRPHGSVTVDSVGQTRAEMAWTSTPFGLGLRDDDGVLTGLLWGEGKGENGPFTVNYLAHRTPQELLELLGVLRSLGDQVRSVRLAEPAGIQLQDLITHVGRQDLMAPGSPHGFRHDAFAWWQARILDLPACMAARRYDGPPVRFGLRLTDPLDLVEGDWTVVVGPDSSATRGTEGDLPVLSASVNAFTRLWLGVRPATALSLTDRLSGPPDLLADLDGAFADLPRPRVGMGF